MKVIAILAALAMTGCATGVQVEAGLAQAADARRSAAALRHAAFCNQSAGAALERYRSPDERAAFMRLCDSPGAQ